MSLPLRSQRAALGLAILLGGSLACTTLSEDDREIRRGEIRAKWQVEISDLAALGPYRAATLIGAQGEWRLYFPRSGACDQLVQEGARPVYRFEGPFGVLVGEDRMVRCSPVGVGRLAAWRDQQPRRRSQYLVPREQARFSPMRTAELEPDGATPSLLLLRGSFPLALELRWPEPMDSVAILPATPACRSQLEHTKTTMEFRAEGPEALVLDGPAGPCPIIGLALPLGL